MAKIVKFDNNAILAGTSGADTLKVYGDDGTLDGGAGNDTYIFGQSYRFDGNSASYGVILEQAAGGTADKVIFDGDRNNYDGISLAENVENLTLVGYADYGYGNEANNILDASQALDGFYGNTSLFGEGGNDTITGSDFDDSLYGGTGNDTLNGGRGDDYLYGDDGVDILNGGYGNDFLVGGEGNDTLNGGDQVEVALSYYNYGYGGDDDLFGYAGNDILNGGNDNISSDAYSAALYAGSDKLYGGEGNDILNGGNDTITQSAAGYAEVLYGGDDTLYGAEGNDILNGGDDILSGGSQGAHSGNENFYASTDHFYGGGGNDVINIGDVTVLGNGGNDGIYGGYSSALGGDGNDTINGGRRTLDGGSGDDVVYGVGEDSGDQFTLVGGYGTDVINGGSITVRGGTGSDLLFGGGFTYYGDERTGENSNNDNDGNDTIRGATQIVDGGAGDDFLYAGYEMYYGGAGNDVIIGGTQTILGGTGNDRVYTNGRAYQQMYGGYGNDTMTAGNVVITGGTGENHIYGDYGRGFGYASLYGFYGNDILNGANGSDELDGGSGNDTLNGNAGNDHLYGGRGNDTLNGGAGNDILRGGYGGDIDNDVLNGGAGDDLYYVSYYGGADTIVADPGGDDTVLVYQETFTAAAGIENILENSSFGDNVFTGNAGNNYIYGGNGDDVLIGLAGSDTLDGGSGDDRMEGGTGNDNYIVDSYGDEVIEISNALGGGTDTVFVLGYGYGDLPDNVENMTLGYGAGATTIFGNNLNNVLIANAYGNTIYGGAGNDTLVSGGGDDELFGGAGNDLYIVEGGDDSVFEVKGGGTDTVRSSGNFILGQDVENLVIVSVESGYSAIGNELVNRIEGGSGDDFIDGGLGNDTLIGGAGNDFFVVNLATELVTELAGGGDSDDVRVDTTATSGTFTMAANVENGEIFGTGDINLTGNASNNVMSGNNGANILDGGAAGNDDLYGGGGNDTLKGGAGNDFLDGEQGNDRMEGGLGNDTYVVNRGDGAGTAIAPSREDQVVELALSGTDTVRSNVYTYTLDANVENLELESGNVARKGFGNALNNVITGNSLRNVLDGKDGNDTLYGAGGNDHLYGGNGNDTLDGGSGTDTLDGGAGNDTFDIVAGLFSDQAVNTTVTGGANTDTVNFHGGLYSVPFFSGFNNDGFTLGADVENLNLSDWADFGNGNALGNVIDASGAYGSFFGSIDLYGAEGNDTIIGSAYGDFIYGGDGNDILQGGNQGDRMYGQDGNDNLQGGNDDGDDFLQGGDGNDIMAGGFGDDIYTVDSATDVVTEALNAGDDLMYVKADTELTLLMGANVEDAVVFYGGVYGGEGHNITGNALDNFIAGDYGDNTISGGAGNDVIFGSTDFDTFIGTSGVDADTLSGDAGDDNIYGGYGNDTLNGGTGNDFLDGGLGNDLMTGGTGNDLYVVDSGGGGAPLATEDRAIEVALGGTDTVEIDRDSGLTAYTLPTEVENLHVTDTGTAITATGNTLANLFTVDFLTNLDSFDGLGGSDTLEAQALYDGGGDGTVTLAGIETVGLYVQLQNDADWTIAAGNVTGQVVSINGYATGTSSLVVNGLAASHTVILGDGPFLDGNVELNLTSAIGATDALNIVLGGAFYNDEVSLTTAGVETLNFTVRGAVNNINVLGVTGEDVLHFTGTTNSLNVGGLTSGDVIQLQNLAVQDLSLLLDDNTAGADELNLELDNAVIGGDAFIGGGDGHDGALTTDSGAAPNVLEVLNIDTRGDPEFANGASFLDGSGIDLQDTDVVLIGGQDLTLVDFGGDDFDASGFGGDLTAIFTSGNTTFTAGVGEDNINMGSGTDTLVFAGELDDFDTVNGGSGTDTLSADFDSGVTHRLHISDVENIDFTLTSGAIVFDLGEIEDGTGTVDIDLLGDTTATVTFFLPDFVGSDARYSIDANLLTTGTLTATTGTANDTLVGGGGNDSLTGLSGSDTLTGGAGDDTFVFNSLSGTDTITDFTVADDQMQLSLSVFGDVGAPASPMTAAAFNSGAGFITGQDADDRIVYNTTDGALYYDSDGNGANAAVQIASLTAIPLVTAVDFDVIS